MKSEFLRLLKRRIARTAISASTARGLPQGTVHAAREFLDAIGLDSIARDSETSFRRWLSSKTAALHKALPEGVPWGAARKFLNIFLRDIFYNKWLHKEFKLAPLEPWLEVPLDSHVMEGMHDDLDAGDLTLPKKKTIKGLKRKNSKTYQESGLQIARKKGIARVHLDLCYWHGDHITNRTTHRDT